MQVKRRLAYQPPSPPPTDEPPPPTGSYPVNPTKTYLVEGTGQIRKIEDVTWAVTTSDWLYGATDTETSQAIGAKIYYYRTVPNFSYNSYTINNAVLIEAPEFKRSQTLAGQFVWGYAFTVTFSNGSKESYPVGQVLTETPNNTYFGLGTSLKVTEQGSSTPRPPWTGPTTPPPPAPPYATSPNSTGGPLSPPTTTKPPRSPFPTTSPNPYGNPTPGFTPIPGKKPNPNDPDDDNPPYPFPPFAPFPVIPGQEPLTRRYDIHDPFISGSTTTNPFPNINPNPNPNLSLIHI